MTKLLLPLAAVLFFFALTAPVVHAHSHLEASDPAVNASVASSPKAIRLTFSMPVETKFSTIRLLGGDGKVIETAPASLDPENPKSLVLQLAQPLAPGEYRVEWHVVAGDSHPMDGGYAFRIKQ